MKTLTYEEGKALTLKTLNRIVKEAAEQGSRGYFLDGLKIERKEPSGNHKITVSYTRVIDPIED